MSAEDIVRRRSVRVTLDKERRFYFGHNGFAEFEDIMGRTLPDFFLSFQEAVTKKKGEKARNREATKFIGFKELRALCYAALIEEDETLTLRATGRLMDQAPGKDTRARVDYLTERVFEAFGKSQGISESRKKKEEESMGTELDTGGREGVEETMEVE